MEKTQARRRQQRRRKVKMAEAWTLVFLMELFVAAIPAGIAAAVFVAMARELRGYAAVGGEWLLVALIFCGAYCATHKWVCNKIFEEGKHE